MVLDLSYFYVCVCQYVSVHTCAGVYRDQRTVGEPLKLELQADVSCLIWVLRTKRRASARAASTFTPRHISAASLQVAFFKAAFY